jgi:hypothetical protein
VPDFDYTDILPLSADGTEYRLITTDGVRAIEADGRTFLEVGGEALRVLAETAMHDIAHYLRTAHLAQLRKTHRPATTTSSSPSTCSRTPTSPRPACCRCARTPAPRS